MCSTSPPGNVAGSGVGDVDAATTPARSGVGFVDGFGDAGEVLDDAAKDAYRRRLSELDESIGEAERFNDIGRAAQLGAERDLLDRPAGASGRARRPRPPCRVGQRAGARQRDAGDPQRHPQDR